MRDQGEGAEPRRTGGRDQCVGSGVVFIVRLDARAPLGGDLVGVVSGAVALYRGVDGSAEIGACVIVAIPGLRACWSAGLWAEGLVGRLAGERRLQALSRGRGQSADRPQADSARPAQDLAQATPQRRAAPAVPTISARRREVAGQGAGLCLRGRRHGLEIAAGSVALYLLSSAMGAPLGLKLGPRRECGSRPTRGPVGSISRFGTTTAAKNAKDEAAAGSVGAGSIGAGRQRGRHDEEA